MSHRRRNTSPDVFDHIHSIHSLASTMRCVSLVFAGLLLLVTGCTQRAHIRALETQLRMYEDQVVSLEHQLGDVEDQLTVAQREATHLRKRVAESGEIVLASEQSDVLFSAEGLRINTLITGGLDEDSAPGDEALSLVVEPFDATDDPIKLPGKIEIKVLDPALDKASEVIGHWEFSPDEVKESWHNGLFVSGFKFRLNWETLPRHSTLVVHAKLTTADGRAFDATSTVTIEPPKETPVEAAAEPEKLPEGSATNGDE